MWQTHIKLAIRSLLKNKLFTAINILGLTIGLAGTMLIYVWVDSELNYDSFYPNAEQLHRVYCAWNGGGDPIYIDAIPIRLKEEAEDKIPEIEQFALLQPNYRQPDLTTASGDVFREKSIAYINENWLETFDYQPIAGSIEAFQADRFSIAITEDYALKYFGTDNPIGQTLTQDSTVYTVNLIVENRPTNSSFYYQMYMPLDAYWATTTPYEQDYESGNYNYIGFFKSDENVDQDAMAAELTSILNAENPDANNSCFVKPITAMRFDEQLRSDYFPHQNKSVVYSFSIVAFLLLLIAGLNYINLSTALLSKNVKEFGVKKAVGARFQHLFAQVMTETMLVSMVALGLAVGLVYLLLPFLSNFVDLDLTLDFKNPSIWLGFAGLLGVSVLTAGAYPALLTGRARPIQLLNNKSTHQRGNGLRRLLVIAQFTASVAILISTFVIYQQLQYIQDKDVGYDRTQVVSIEPRLWRGEGSDDNFMKFRTYKKELEALAGFSSVALTDASVEGINNQNSGSLDWEGKPEDFTANVYQMRADEDLQAVFDFQLAEGRWFEEARSTDDNNIILNEAAIKSFNIPSPVVGRKVSFQGRDGEIIGVTKDFNFGSLREAVSPLVIWNSQGGGNKILARISSNDPQSVMATAQTLFNERIPGVDFAYNFIEDKFILLHEAETRISTLFQIFAGLLIFISCLGLLGLAVFAAERRTKEIGIRKVLGASVTRIVALLSKDFIKLVLIAFVIATPIAYYFMKSWLQDFAYRIDLQWWMFALAGVAAIGIALLTVSVQSVRAALANPVTSLRSE